MKPKNNVLERLKAQRDKLEARIQATEARSKTAERKKDTRRKILVGSYYLDQAQKNNQMGDITKQMDGYLKRNSDRKLLAATPDVYHTDPPNSGLDGVFVGRRRRSENRHPSQCVAGRRIVGTGASSVVERYFERIWILVIGTTGFDRIDAQFSGPRAILRWAGKIGPIVEWPNAQRFVAGSRCPNQSIGTHRYG